MRANPGGQLAASEIIGREKLIERILRSLDRQSVVLSAERRIGKTSIMLKMKEEADPRAVIVFFSDLERIYTPLELVETVLRDVEEHLSLRQKSANTFRKLFKHLAGAEVGGVVKLPAAVALHWKDLLVSIINDLMQQEERLIYFFWDEVPLMLYNIKKREGEAAAMEILDTLRALRQSHKNLRMIFTGSIGLHNVLTSLRKTGYANDPTNDMDTIEVPPLEPDKAERLASLLIQGERIKISKPEEITQTIASEVNGFPYFIHHVVDEMARREGDGEFDSDTVRQIVATALTDAQDRWHLRWYRERIDNYYEPDERAIALALLDALCASEEPLSFDELFNLVKHKIKIEDAEPVREILNRLGKDHYTAQNATGGYAFRFPLIKRYWRLHRGL
jgi:AAA+ ATPase superfamily predicted ATPase